MPEKLDLHQIHKAEYVSPKKPVLINTQPAVYLAIEGKGAPGGEDFADRMGALYGMAFTIKMTRKFDGLGDYVIGKLEAQWWAPDGVCFGSLPKEKWSWKVLIRTPEFITESDLANARKKLIDKGKPQSVNQVKLEKLAEGQCVQMLHVGPYEKESETIALMEAFAQQRNLAFAGRHHEIYLSDPRRVPPERLRTILRHPLSPV